jgi:hypothetical protein
MGWLRFRDLKARGIVNSRQALKKLQEDYGFPLGRLIGENTRAWHEESELNPWLASRPTALKKTAKSPGRPRKQKENEAQPA